MTPVSGSGTRSEASKVKRTDGESWQGKIVRALIGWHWVNK